jgi:hypothetical protein
MTMWIASGAKPADESLTPEQIHEAHQRLSPPENEFPAGVGLTVLLGRTEDAAVGITQFEAFSTGFRFTIAVRTRRPRPALAYGGLSALINSYAIPGVEIALEDRLLLGIEYADGQRASNLQDMGTSRSGAETEGQRMLFFQAGGGGGEHSVDFTYWVSPLPPEGPMTFVLAWPNFGMPESRTVLDSALIRDATQHVLTLWPPDPEAGRRPKPPRPPRPSSGWFAEPAG